MVQNDNAQPPTSDQRAPVEALMLGLGRMGVRTVALTSPTEVLTVRALSRALCASYAAADVKTVLIDLAVAAPYHDADPGWNPGVRLNPSLTFRDPDGFDQVAAWPTESTRPLFNNLQHLRRALTEDLAAYNAIVVNLAPILRPSPGAPNPLAVGRAADGVLMVCGTGRTIVGDAAKSVADLTAAGCKVIGTVLDNSAGTYPGRELARTLERSKFVPHWLSKWATPTLRNSQFLNP